jgi:hypothetical protein
MKALAIAALLLLQAGAGEHRAEDLAWLAGSWVSEKDGRWTEERWGPPRGGVMLGATLIGRGDEATGYEFMRIAPDKDGRLAFWGSPEGAPAVSFHLVASDAQAVTFENPAHDFPTRITYRRQGEVLSATISGPGGAKEKSWTYRRR